MLQSTNMEYEKFYEVLCVDMKYFSDMKVAAGLKMNELGNIETLYKNCYREVIIRGIPVLPLLHNDIENGQSYRHYHVDFRFSLPVGSPYRINEDTLIKKAYSQILECRSLIYPITTPVRNIKNSKLKHKCIYRGKCPHRGYDLSGETPDERGVITCPLHGLKFDISGKIINFPQKL